MMDVLPEPEEEEERPGDARRDGPDGRAPRARRRPSEDASAATLMHHKRIRMYIQMAMLIVLVCMLIASLCRVLFGQDKDGQHADNINAVLRVLNQMGQVHALPLSAGPPPSPSSEWHAGLDEVSEEVPTRASMPNGTRF